MQSNTISPSNQLVSMEIQCCSVLLPTMKIEMPANITCLLWSSTSRTLQTIIVPLFSFFWPTEFANHFELCLYQFISKHWLCQQWIGELVCFCWISLINLDSLRAFGFLLLVLWRFSLSCKPRTFRSQNRFGFILCQMLWTKIGSIFQVSFHTNSE